MENEKYNIMSKSTSEFEGIKKQIRIAISGKARCGKDTICNYLKLLLHSLFNREYKVKVLSFALPLYTCLYSCQEVLELPLEKDRNFLQIVGDWARDINEDIFVELLERKLEDYEEYELILISDVRFENELEMLKKNGFKIIRVNRDINMLNENQANHKSEINLDNYSDYDYVIENNGTLNELYEKLRVIINNIFNNISLINKI